MSTTTKPPPGGVCARFFKVIWFWIVLIVRLGLYNNIIELFKRPKKFELPRRSDEVVVITGGARGIGLETVKILLQCDFTVVLGVRNTNAGEAALSKIRESGVSEGKTIILPLDLTSIQSVRTFADKVLQQTSRIDLLINNAGIMFGPYEETEDGYESQFQVNYLSHFLLTNLLLPRMKETGSKRNSCSRIINVSSNANFGGRLDFTDLEKCKVYADNKSYQDSKLAQVLHAKYLDKILVQEGANVHAYALHPGVIPSGLYVNVMPVVNLFISCLSCIFRNTIDGAWTVMYAALSSEIEEKGGSYINTNETVRPNSCADDASLQKLLWERSLLLIDPNYLQIQANNGFYKGA